MDIYVKDFRKPGMTDDECIAACMAHCAAQGLKDPVVVFNGGDWHIGSAILVSSGMTVIVDGCAIKQNDGTFDNVFRGSNVTVDPHNPYDWPLDVAPLSDIKILGRNGARIIGPDVNRRSFNPLRNEEQDMTGDAWGWRTLQISLAKCANFEIGGLSFYRTRCWTMAFDLCTHGYIHDIHLETYVKNGDGIDLEPGCRHIRIQNITGRTSDDTVALHGLWYGASDFHIRCIYPMQTALNPAKIEDRSALDIYDIDISDIFTGGDYHGIICAAYSGIQIYNVNIRNVHEIGQGKRRAVMEAYTDYGYGEGYSPGDMHDIRVDGITARYSQFAFMNNTAVDKVTLKNISHTAPGGQRLNLVIPDGIQEE
jgi:hypothetical protein